MCYQYKQYLEDEEFTSDETASVGSFTSHNNTSVHVILVTLDVGLQVHSLAYVMAGPACWVTTSG